MMRTLSSLAMVATVWDVRRKDYIDCLIPFLANTIINRDINEIDVDVMCEYFKEDYGLSIPFHPMLTLINRAKRSGLVMKKGAIAHVDKKVTLKQSFSGRDTETVRVFDQILVDIVEFAKKTFDVSLSNQEVEDAFISFLSEHDMAILFATQGESSLPKVESDKSNKYIICKFIEFVFSKKPAKIKLLTDIAIGHVMTNSLLIGDVSKYKSKPSKLNIFLDTRFILRLIGVEGDMRKNAYGELVKLMKEKEGTLYVFEHTYNEIMTILNGCKRWLQNESYDPAKAGNALKYFVMKNFKPSNLDIFIIRFPDKLESHSISIWPAMDVDKYRKYQIDDVKLTSEIKSVYSDQFFDFVDWRLEEGIAKDVKSISYVNLLRQGKMAHSMSEAKYVFVTTNGGLARANQSFEKNEGRGSNIYACITDVFIGTVLWAQSPGILRSITMKNMIANTMAALQPDHLLLTAYIKKVNDLEKDGAITNNESLVLRSHQLTMNLLSDKTMGNPDNITDKTPHEILEEIKAIAKKEALEERNFAQKERDKALERASELESKLEEQYDRHAKHCLKVERWAELIAQIISLAIYITVCAMLVAGAYYSWRPSEKNTILTYFCALLVVILPLIGYIWGISLKDLRLKLQGHMKQMLVRKLL
ncbi:hypothetical protein KAR91_44050 [Candidatus Pacearchaeota archaeon]|nr:hypothetical protein [Candidatus Pacearchaeota archaeon]